MISTHDKTGPVWVFFSLSEALIIQEPLSSDFPLCKSWSSCQRKNPILSGRDTSAAPPRALPLLLADLPRPFPEPWDAVSGGPAPFLLQDDVKEKQPYPCSQQEVEVMTQVATGFWSSDRAGSFTSCLPNPEHGIKSPTPSVSCCALEREHLASNKRRNRISLLCVFIMRVN